jgi:hypothetical protein
VQERARLINHMATQPERQWTSSCWSFKNEGKVYGSPMFDALWFEVLQVCDGGESQSLCQAAYSERLEVVTLLIQGTTRQCCWYTT